jgi:PilZ domain
VSVGAGRRSDVPFRVLNLSVTGAKLEGPLALRLHEKIRIKLTIEEKSVELEAEIVRVNTADLMTDQIAARFLQPSAEAVNLLQHIVDQALYVDIDDVKHQETAKLPVVAKDDDKT